LQREYTLRSSKRRLVWLVALLAAVGLVAGACGSDSDDSSDTGSTGTSGSSSGGSINISGSSTVEPISSRVAELYVDAGNSASITVDGPGTGDGFQVFCAGETDISDASRPISEKEITQCADAGIEYIELEVAYDGMAVITNPANTTIECLSFEDLYALVGPESTGFGNWSDAQELATELGSTTQFPDASLDITAPGTESGTYDSFIEIALADIGEARFEGGKISEEEAETTRPDYSSQANDNAILQGIEGSDTSFGWVGFAFAEEAGDAVKEIPIQNEDGECIAPTAETIADGTYPLSRSLYIYVNAEKATANTTLVDYVDYYLGDGYAAVEEVGYIPLPADKLAATQKTWDDRTTGTTAGS
jgi:phosphate transport system substrate-binding protein